MHPKAIIVNQRKSQSHDKPCVKLRGYGESRDDFGSKKEARMAMLLGRGMACMAC
jgi:hypothetical protein